MNIAACSRVPNCPAPPVRPSVEEFVSNQSYLLQLSKESEIRFGPPYFKAAIYSGEGKLVADFGSRRFFSYPEYQPGDSVWASPWNPKSAHLALLELLNINPGPGTKLGKVHIYDVARQASIATWDFASLITHKMWSSDGRLYLFRDLYALHVFSQDHYNLVSIASSSSDECFLTKCEFICVVNRRGEITVFEAVSGRRLASAHVPAQGYSVKCTFLDNRQENISVILKSQSHPSAEELCYAISLD